MEERVLSGRYALQHLIGTGGVAQVFRAVDRLLGREVAVKILKPETAADPTFVQRFNREARAAAALNHANVVSIYDWGTAEGSDYLVMEYVPGQNLKEILSQRGRLSEAEALDICAQIAAALDAAHRRGFIHRDVKPQNVLVDPEAHVKVADFGVVRAAGVTQLTAPNVVCGTVHYLSPEQATGQAMDQRSDIYSLGVVLYELLTGTIPFEADSAVAVALRHVHDRPRPPRELRPDISPAAQQIALKALAKDPAERYQTAAEMMRALRQARTELSVASAATRHNRIAEAGAAAPIQRRQERNGAPPRGRTDRAGWREREERQRAWGLLFGLPILLLAIVAGAILATRPGGPVAQGRLTKPPATVTAAPATRVQAMPTRPARNASAGPLSGTNPTAAPTAAVARPTPTATSPPPSTPPPTSTPAAAGAPPAIAVAQSESADASGPRRAVLSFYQLISNHEFSRAALLWSRHMQSVWPPQDSIDHRFAGTQQIDVVRAQITNIDRSVGQATVAVDLLEFTDGSPSPIRWTGTWSLVRGPTGWLLDSPDLHQA